MWETQTKQANRGGASAEQRERERGESFGYGKMAGEKIENKRRDGRDKNDKKPVIKESVYVCVCTYPMIMATK